MSKRLKWFATVLAVTLVGCSVMRRDQTPLRTATAPVSALPHQTHPQQRPATTLDVRQTGSLDVQFTTVVRPFINTYCVSCHGGEKPEAELNLQTYSSLAAVRSDSRWGLVLDRVRAGEMPAPDADEFPSPEARGRVVAWFEGLRANEIARNAGDPGTVLARRLSNAEYDYTVRDLTGIDMKPTREFPSDPANSAGFDNSGESLHMSPALLNKYLKTAHDVASHMVLKPKGFAFADSMMLSDSDRDRYCVHRIIDFYHRQNTDYLDYFAAAWRFKYRSVFGMPNATLADVARASRVSPKYLATLWDMFEGSTDSVGPIAKVQALWRSLPVPGPAGSDTAIAGRAALRDYIVTLRAKIEPRFLNITAGRVGPGAQPLLIWKNVQYATHRMTFDPAQLQVEGEPPSAPPTTAEPGATGAFGPGATRLITNMPGDADLAVPVGQRVRYEKAFAQFSRVFPDMFYMQERGRNYFDTTKDRGRLLDAGFHSLMGYFRDDQPLYELLLDDAQQAELDEMWLEMDVVASTTARMYAQFFENGSRQGGGGAIPLPEDTGPKEEPVTSATRLGVMKAAYAQAASTGDERGVQAASAYFDWVNARVRLTEKTRLDAEPGHLDALLKFAETAYRRPLSRDERAELLACYRASRQQDGLSHEAAMRESIVAVLMSPDMMYRIDRAGSGSGRQPLSNYALASRLSYFLWSSLPDAELLRHAAAGDLHQPRVIAAQARRMLKDPRVRGLAVEFGANWLDIRSFEELGTVDRERFPSFTDDLRTAMFEEPVRLILDVFQKDRPVTDLLFGGDTFVNSVLAKHYGMPEPSGEATQWRRVEDATRYERGGLLPMAAFLTKNAPGLRTSPVKRGNWVVRNILGERISPPPPGVPQLPQDESTLDLPLRDMLARHREAPECAACHAKFDALGLAFEGYGPTGERRDKDLAGRVIDASATFPGGMGGTGLDGVRSYIRTSRQHDFVTNMSGKLLAFALGRSLLITDEPTVEDITRKLAGNGYRSSGMIESIVTSPQFLTKRGEPADTDR